jgi:raffinose/stachyose/melibiose transport system substrate-binding protein
MIHKRARWSIVAALAILLGVPSLAPAQTEITFWTWRVEDEQAYERFFEAFREEHPDIDIEFQAFESSTYNTVLSSALAAGEGPDVIHVRAYGNFETFAEPGYLVPLDDEVPALADFPALALQGETLRSDGRVYAVPFATQTLLILYNTEIFDELGLEEPTSWSEFLETSQRIADAGYIPIANGTATDWMLEALYGAFAPNFYGPEFFDDVVSGATTFEDDRFVHSLERLLELTPYLAPGYVGVDYPASQALFTNGLAAMFVGGSWEIASFRNQNPDLVLDVMAPPAENEGDPQYVSSFLDGGYAVNSDSDEQGAALELVRFLATERFGQMLTDELANISPIPGVEPSDPLLQQVAQLNQTSSPYVTLVGFRYENPTGSALIQEGLQRMFTGSWTPRQVASALTEGIGAYYEAWQNAQ